MNEQFDIYLDNTICDIIKDSGGFQTRHKSMIKMITNSWNKIIKDKLKDNEKIELSVFTGDNYGKSDNGLSVAMAGEKKDYDNLVPAFVFENWAEAGIHDYTEKIKQISDAGLKKYEFDKVFWRGNVSTHHTRKKLIEYGLKHKSTTDFDGINWTNAKNKIVSLEEHAKFRVLIDIQGIGHSGRIPYLLASRRPVIIQKRKVEQWYYFNDTLKPFIHYIPCEEDLSDLDKVIKWTFDNKEKAEEIGKAGHDYVMTYLTKDKIYERFAEVLLSKIQKRDELERVFLQIKKDANDFKYTDTTLTKLEVVMQTDFNLDHHIMKVEIKNNKATIMHYPKAYQRRGEGMIKIINMALQYGKINDSILYLHVADEYIYRFQDLPFFIIAKPIDKKGLLFVDETFVDIEPESKTAIDKNHMIDWEENVEFVKNKCNNITKENKIYFIGQNIALKKTNFNMRKWLSENTASPFEVLLNDKHGYVPNSDFCKYKYLLNLPGMSPWSFRLKTLFLMKSFIINIALRRKYGDSYDDKWINIFDRLFESGKDYIELDYLYSEKEDNNNKLIKLQKTIKELYDKYEKDKSKYDEIVNNGFEKGKLINMDNIKKVTHNILTTYSKNINVSIKLPIFLQKNENIVKFIKNNKNLYNLLNTKSGNINGITFKQIGEGIQGAVFLLNNKENTWIVKKSKLQIPRYEPYREIYFGDIINDINKYHDFLHYYDYNVIGNYFYLSMEPADGDLIKWSIQKKSSDEWKFMIFQILNQIVQLQNVNITHCDLQAKNIVFKNKSNNIKTKINNRIIELNGQNQFYVIDFGISSHPDLSINLISKEDMENKNYDLKRFSKIPDKLKSINVKNKYNYNQLYDKLTHCKKVEQNNDFFNKFLYYCFSKINIIIEKIDITKYAYLNDEFNNFIKSKENNKITKEIIEEVKYKVLEIYDKLPNTKKVILNKHKVMKSIERKSKSLFKTMNDCKIKINNIYKKTKDWFGSKQEQQDYLHGALAYYYVKSGYFTNDDYCDNSPAKIPSDIEFLFDELNKYRGNLNEWLSNNY